MPFKSLMIYRFCIAFMSLFCCSLCWAASSPEPYFMRYTKIYDLKNQKKLLLRKKTKASVQESQVQILLEKEEDVWSDLSPELTPEISQQIKSYQEDLARQNEINQNAFYEVKNSQKLENIRDNFMKHYLEKRVVNGFIIKNIKKSNPSIDNLEKGVKKLSGEEVEEKKIPNPEPPSDKEVAQVPEESWNIDVGSRFDFIRQRGRTWFNCDFFNSEAKIDAGGFSRLNYQVRISKDLSLSEDKFSPFAVVKTSLEVNQEETSGQINTNLSENLQLNYTSLFSSKDSVVQFFYNIKF
jgi:hypothetical protein